MLLAYYSWWYKCQMKNKLKQIGLQMITLRSARQAHLFRPRFPCWDLQEFLCCWFFPHQTRTSRSLKLDKQNSYRSSGADSRSPLASWVGSCFWFWIWLPRRPHLKRKYLTFHFEIQSFNVGGVLGGSVGFFLPAVLLPIHFLYIIKCRTFQPKFYSNIFHQPSTQIFILKLYSESCSIWRKIIPKLKSTINLFKKFVFKYFFMHHSFCKFVFPLLIGMMMCLGPVISTAVSNLCSSFPLSVITVIPSITNSSLSELFPVWPTVSSNISKCSVTSNYKLNSYSQPPFRHSSIFSLSS